MIFIDHDDSFSNNVIDWLERAGCDVTRIMASDAKAMAKVSEIRTPVVLGPGPKGPQDVPQTLALAQHLLGRVPVLGICLGHQVLATLAGMPVERKPNAEHGVLQALELTADPGVLARFSGERVAVYNSLIARVAANVPAPWVITAASDGCVQALEYRGTCPAVGWQFHPESFLTAQAATFAGVWHRLAYDAASRP